MAPVLKLIQRNNRQTVALFDGLSDLARLEEVDDVIVCYRKRGKPLKIATAGVYRDSTAEALRAIMKASVHLTQLEDMGRGAP